jgi:hypothetical protein
MEESEKKLNVSLCGQTLRVTPVMEKGMLALSGATTATGLRKVPRDTFQLYAALKLHEFQPLQQHNSTMRFLRSLIPSLLLLGAGVAEAASSWNFDEAIISVTGKGNTAGAFKDKCVDSFIFRRGHLLIPIAQTLGSCSSCEARNIRLGRFP